MLPHAHLHKHRLLGGWHQSGCTPEGRWGLRFHRLKSRSFCNYQEILFIFSNLIVRRAQLGIFLLLFIPLFI